MVCIFTAVASSSFSRAEWFACGRILLAQQYEGDVLEQQCTD